MDGPPLDTSGMSLKPTRCSGNVCNNDLLCISPHPPAFCLAFLTKPRCVGAKCVSGMARAALAVATHCWKHSWSTGLVSAKSYFGISIFPQCVSVGGGHRHIIAPNDLTDTLPFCSFKAVKVFPDCPPNDLIVAAYLLHCSIPSRLPEKIKLPPKCDSFRVRAVSHKASTLSRGGALTLST